MIIGYRKFCSPVKNAIVIRLTDFFVSQLTLQAPTKEIKTSQVFWEEQEKARVQQIM